MATIDVVQGGYVVIRALLDEDDNIIDAIGSEAWMVEDLRHAGNATGNSLISKVARNHGIVTGDGNTLEPINNPPPIPMTTPEEDEELIEQAKYRQNRKNRECR